MPGRYFLLWFEAHAFAFPLSSAIAVMTMTNSERRPPAEVTCDQGMDGTGR
jgi:hypothetical protein